MHTYKYTLCLQNSNTVTQLHIYIHMYIHACDIVNSYNIGTNDHDLPDNVATYVQSQGYTFQAHHLFLRMLQLIL